MICVGDGVRFSMAAWVVTKERYVSACQYLLLVALLATVVISVAGVARLDIVGHPSSVTSPTAHATSPTGSGR